MLGQTLAALGLDALSTRIAESLSGTLPRVNLPGRGTQVVAWSTTTGGNTAIVFQPRDVFLGPINRLAKTALIALAVVALVALALALLVARRLSRPVSALTAAATAIEANTEPDTEQLASLGRTKDDIGRLARVFSSMAAQVAVRERALRDQVAALRVEINEDRRKQTVSDLTDSEFFRELEVRAAQIRRAMKEDL